MARIAALPVVLGVAVWAGVTAGARVGVAQGEAPDLVIHNAKVITVDKAFSIAEAVAVAGGEIVAVGRNDAVRPLAGPRTRVVDLRGRTLLPGFHDTHSHAVQMGLNLPVAMDLTTVTSIEDIRKIVARRVASAKPGEWIFSEGGWWQFMLSDKRLPTRHDLDPVSPRNPVVLRGGHYWIANSAALQQIGYTKDTPDPPGGEIWRDPNGEPTGYLLKTAYRPILPFVPKPSRDTQLEGVRQAIARMNSWGMTSYREAGGTRDYVEILRELHGKGHLTIRVDFSYDVDPNTPERDLDAVFKALGPPGQQWGNGVFRADTLAEVFLDGAEESGLLRSGYQGRPEYRGIQLVEQKQLNVFAAAAARHGWRPTPHAVGDAAIDQALEAFEYAHARTPITNRRWMIDHAILLQPDQYERVRRLGLVINAQPRHNFIIGDKFIEFWGMPRAQMAYRFRDWLDNGIVLALGADRPISFRASPLMQIDIAVTRRTGWGGVLGPDQGISREEAIRAITATAAYSSFEERTKGSVEPGKYADFVVLSRDILTVPARDIGSIEVAATVLGGKVVYGSLPQ
jgi:predicted amidohydrolase YtcJ